MTFAEWDKTTSQKWPFFSVEESGAIVSAIRTALMTPRTSTRINGLPGLGKTRTALQACRGAGEEQHLSSKVVYFDAQYDSQSPIANFAKDLLRRKAIGTLVVDNCPDVVHQSLQATIFAVDSKLNILTIYSDPLEIAPDAVNLLMRPISVSQMSILIKEYLKGIDDVDAGKVATLAGGFVFFALLLCDAWRNQRGINEALPATRQFLNLLWGFGEKENEPARKVIESCSLFESIFYNSGSSPEANIVRELTGLNDADFHRHVINFRDRGLIEVTGDFLRVRPHPLAIHLCQGWWRAMLPERAKAFFDSVPESMITALCERLRMMNYLPEAQQLAADLCGPQGPFGQAEVLTSARGARIFRALAELNPEAASAALYRMLQESKESTLKESREARREWVWTLDKLTFLASTYRQSAEALVFLAVSETEVYANNSTGTLLDTFQVSLPGTQASLVERADYLSNLFRSKDHRIVNLALDAADRGLKTEYFSRMSGGEEYGSSHPLMDYEAQSAEELLVYWRSILEAMDEAVVQKRLLASNAAHVLAMHIRGFVRTGFHEVSADIVAKVTSWGIRPWEEGVDALRDAVRFEGEAQSKERLQQINSWIEGLSARADDWAGQLLMHVSRPGWSDIADEEEKSNGSTPLKDRLRELALHGAQNFVQWKPYLTELFYGEQRLGFLFGQELSKCMTKNGEFIEFAFSLLRGNTRDDLNLSVLSGFISEASSKNKEWAIYISNHILEELSLAFCASQLIRNTQPDISILIRLVKLTADRNLGSSTLRNFSYGRALEHLSGNDVGQFMRSISGLDKEGPWVALSLGFMWSFNGGNEKWVEVREPIRELHLSDGISMAIPHDSHDNYAWERTALRLLKERDEQLAAILAKQFIAAGDAHISPHSLPDNVLEELLKNYVSVVWPLFGRALSEDKGRKARNLMRFIGRGMRGAPEQGGYPLEKVDLNVLQQWLRSNTEAAPGLAAMIRPVHYVDGALQWTELAVVLIDTYGLDREVLTTLGGNLMTGVWSGPRLEFYEKLKNLLLQSKSHSFKTVRDWVQGSIEVLSSRIQIEQQQIDARTVGRY